jgi:hypothetical protein
MNENADEDDYEGIKLRYFFISKSYIPKRKR